MTNDIPTITPARTPATVTLLGRINREWRTMSHRPALLARARRWDLGFEFTSLDELVAAAGFRPYARGGYGVPSPALPEGVDHNEVLARLLRAARTDELAARVVLQRLLTGLLAAARRWIHRDEGGDDALEEVLGAAWTVIRTFPVERRPEHLAANLLRDAEYHAFRRAGRRAIVHEPVPTERLDRPVLDRRLDEDDDPGAELDELVGASRQLLSPRDLEVLRLLLAGHTQAEVAALLRVSVRTVWNRRDAVVHQLRQTAQALQAA